MVFEYKVALSPPCSLEHEVALALTVAPEQGVTLSSLVWWLGAALGSIPLRLLDSMGLNLLLCVRRSQENTDYEYLSFFGSSTINQTNPVSRLLVQPSQNTV